MSSSCRPSRQETQSRDRVQRRPRGTAWAPRRGLAAGAGTHEAEGGLMKRVVVEEPGGPEQLRVVESATPEPAPGEALIAIATSGVNFIDVYFRTGLYPSDRPIALGSEAAGVVERTGDGVTTVK